MIYRHISNVERLLDKIRRLKNERDRLLDTGAPLHEVYSINCRIYELEEDPWNMEKI